jgi:hypothetical protein
MDSTIRTAKVLPKPSNKLEKNFFIKINLSNLYLIVTIHYNGVSMGYIVFGGIPQVPLAGATPLHPPTATIYE